MAKLNEDQKWLMDNLKANGLEISNADDFASIFTNEEDSKWAYDNAVKNGLEVGNYDEFVRDFNPNASASSVGSTLGNVAKGVGIAAKAANAVANPVASLPQAIGGVVGTGRMKDWGKTALASAGSAIVNYGAKMPGRILDEVASATPIAIPGDGKIMTTPYGMPYAVSGQLQKGASYDEKRDAAKRVADGTATEEDYRTSVLTRGVDDIANLQERLSKAARPDGISEDEGFVDLISRGAIEEALQLGLGTAIESAPATAMAMNPVGAVALGAMSAADEYDTLAQEHPEVSQVQRAAASIGYGTIEQAVERWFNPFKGLPKPAVRGALKNIEKGAGKLVRNNILKQLGKSTIEEGLEEVATQIGDDALFSALDYMFNENAMGYAAQFDEFKKDHPEISEDEAVSNFSAIKGKELLDNFIGGAMGGLFMGGGRTAYDATSGNINTKEVQQDLENTSMAIDAVAKEMGMTREGVAAVYDRVANGDPNSEATGDLMRRLNYKVSELATVDARIAPVVERVTNKTDNNIYLVSDKDGNEGNIIRGNVVLNEDGTVDLEKSDNMVTVVGNDGEAHSVALGSLTLDHTEDSESFVQGMKAREMARIQAQDTFKVGDKVYLTSNGELVPDENPSTVVANDENGVMITSQNEDGSVTTQTLDPEVASQNMTTEGAVTGVRNYTNSQTGSNVEVTDNGDGTLTIKDGNINERIAKEDVDALVARGTLVPVVEDVQPQQAAQPTPAQIYSQANGENAQDQIVSDIAHTQEAIPAAEEEMMNAQIALEEANEALKKGPSAYLVQRNPALAKQRDKLVKAQQKAQQRYDQANATLDGLNATLAELQTIFDEMSTPTQAETATQGANVAQGVQVPTAQQSQPTTQNANSGENVLPSQENVVPLQRDNKHLHIWQAELQQHFAQTSAIPVRVFTFVDIENGNKEMGMEPQDLASARKAIRDGKLIQGYYNPTTDQVVIFADAFTDSHAADVVANAHEGLHQLIATDEAARLGVDELATSHTGDELRAMHEALGVDEFYRQRYSGNTLDDRLVLAEELMAHMSEYNAAYRVPVDEMCDMVGATEQDKNNINYVINGNNARSKNAASPSGKFGIQRSSRQGNVGQDGGNLQGQPAALEESGYGLNERGNQAVGQIESNEDAFDAVGTSTGIEIETDGKPVGGRFSTVGNFEGAGFVCRDEEGNPLVDKDGKVYVEMNGKRFDADHLTSADDLSANKNSVLSMLLEDAVNEGAINKTKANTILHKYSELLNKYLKEGAKGWEAMSGKDAKWRWFAETVYHTVSQNGDAQYLKSLDITKVCKKNEAIINTISEVQRRLGYGITPAQIMDIYLKTDESGYQTPCPVCYVFARYIRNGKYATAAINGMKKYGEHLPGGNKEWSVKQWVSELHRLEEMYKSPKVKDALKKANEDVVVILEKIDALGEIATDAKKTQKERKDAIKEIKKLDKQYRAALQIVSQQSLTNWIKMFAIKSNANAKADFFEDVTILDTNNDGEEIPEEKREKKVVKWVMRDDAVMPTDMTDFSNNALDFGMTANVIQRYPGIMRLRKSGGSAAGKTITFVANNDLGDVVYGLSQANAEKNTTAEDNYAKAANTKDEAEKLVYLKRAQEARMSAYRKAAKAEPGSKEFAKQRKAATAAFKKAYKYAQQQSLRGGQRMWSWSDNIESLSPDVVVNMMQMSMLNGALQSYSKQLEGINLVATMNGYVNGSLMGYGLGYVEVSPDQVKEENGRLIYTGKDIIKNDKKGKHIQTKSGSQVMQLEDGRYITLVFDDVVGIEAYGQNGKEGLFDLNNRLDKAGNIIVGMDDAHILASMNDDRIFFIIPWHASGQSTHILTQMYNYLGVELTQNGNGAQDYTKVQEEKQATKLDGKQHKKLLELYNQVKNESDFGCAFPIDHNCAAGKISDSQSAYRELRNAIFDGIDKLTPAQKSAIKKDAFLSQVMRKMKERGLNEMTSKDKDFIYPYEYWDEESTIDGRDDTNSADINGARYLEYCRRLGYKPKFCGMLGEGSTEFGNFVGKKGYWKLLIDRRMYDTNGRFQDLGACSSENFFEDSIDPKWTNDHFKVTRVADDDGVQKIADSVIELESSRSEDGVPLVDYSLDMERAVDKYNAGSFSVKSEPKWSPKRRLDEYTYNVDDEHKQMVADVLEEYDNGEIWSMGDAIDELSYRNDDADNELLTLIERYNDKADYAERYDGREHDEALYDLEEEAENALRSIVGEPNDPNGGRLSIQDGESLIDYAKRISTAKNNPYSVSNSYEKEAEANGRFSMVSDRSEIARLERSRKKKVFRSMQLINGKLYPPMSLYDFNGKMREPSEIGVWYKADEDPNAAKKKDSGKVDLKRKGETTGNVVYAPYFHTTTSPLNDQFSGAYLRPELVTVEVKIPASELNGDYQAEGSPRTTGEHEWPNGPVGRQLPKDMKRKVILSRWAKITRIVPNSEVAANIKKYLNGHDVKIPFNTVNPSLRAELEKIGVEVVEGRKFKKGTEEGYRKQLNEARGKFSISAKQDEDYRKAVESGDIEKAQQLVDDVAKDAGYTIEGYHGTTNRFYVFDKDKANTEGNWGAGFYFTNSEEDVDENYANEDGADLTAKVKLLAERLEDADGYEDMDYEERLHAARKQLSEGEPRTISAYLKIDNPIVIGGSNETFLDADISSDKEDYYDEEPSGLLVDYIESLQDVINESPFNSRIDLSGLYDYVYEGGAGASLIEDESRKLLDEGGYMDEDGNMATGDAIRIAFKNIGFDGIVDNRVNQKFGTKRRYGQSMNGVDEDTQHIIVFNPNQIKSAEPATYDDNGNLIPLNERFNEKDNDIRFSIKSNPKEFKDAAAEIFGKYRLHQTGDVISLMDELEDSNKNTINNPEVADIISEMRDIWNGMDMGDVFDERDSFMEELEARVMTAVNNTGRFSIAYHGSGADFNKFDMSFANSGTGDMLYGHGVYVTDNEAIGKEYAELNAKEGEGNRKLYTVDIPDDNGRNYFDWEKTYSKAEVAKIGNKVIDAMLADPDNEGMYTEADRKNMLLDYGFDIAENGGSLYGGISAALGSDNAASELLKSLGYVGNKVPVGYTTDDDRKGTNYVIYDENDVKITNKGRFSVSEREEDARTPELGDTEAISDFERRLQKYTREELEKAKLNPEEMTYKELASQAHMITSKLNNDNAEAVAKSMRTIKDRINALRDAKNVQRSYDRTTTRLATNLAKMMITHGYADGISAGELNRILMAIQRANGATDITPHIDLLIDAMTRCQQRKMQKLLKKVTEPVKKVNQTRIEVARGVLGDQAEIINAFNKFFIKDKNGNMRFDEMAYTNTRDVINERLDQEDLPEDVRKMYENQRAAIELCDAYMFNIEGVKSDIFNLESEINLETARLKGLKDIEREAKKELIAALRQQLQDANLQLIDNYDEFISRVADMRSEGHNAYKDFVEARKERKRNIIHYMNSDQEGVIPIKHEKKQGMLEESFQTIADGLSSPLHTMLYDLKRFAVNAPEGKGYLYTHFANGIVNASENERLGVVDAKGKLDAKAQELFGMDYIKAMNKYGTLPLDADVTLSSKVYDKEDVLSAGQIMYLYMVNKMTDGKMKLRAMGISEEDVNNAVEVLRKTEPKMIELADWLQNDFLVGLREKYNGTYKRIYGVSMPFVRNYAPLKIEKTALKQEVDLNSVSAENQLPSTVTGNILKRSVNTKPIDIAGTNAMELMLEHVNTMEHWNAYAEITQDLNTLLSATGFRNKVEALGKGGYDKFFVAAKIATGNYDDKAKGLNKFVNFVLRGFAGAKVSFRVQTAIKQLFSFPAFLDEANPEFYKAIGKTLFTPKDNFQWCLENLPLFEKRWNGKMAGDEKLDISDGLSGKWGKVARKYQDNFAKYGMWANSLIDATTCAAGAKAMYDYKKKQYLDRGYAEERAEDMAKKDAEICYNETQQSSEGLMMSQIQSDRDFVSTSVSVFNNSSFAYGRKFVEGLREAKKVLRDNGKMEEFRKKQLMRDGLTEESATKAAKEDMKKAKAKAFADIAIFGFGIQLAWNMGGAMYATLGHLIGSAVGGGDPEKDEHFWDDLFIVSLIQPIRGFVFGASAESLLKKAIDIKHQKDDGKYNSFRNNWSAWLDDQENPAKKDIANVLEMVFEDDKDAYKVANVLIRTVGSRTGVDPNTLANAMYALSDLVDNAKDGEITWTDIYQDWGLLVNAPGSQVKDYFLQPRPGESVKDVADRYVRYKKLQTYGVLTPFAEDKKPTKADIKKAKESVKAERKRER